MSKTKMAIVGFSESSRHLAPYSDPEFEIWACNHVYRFIPRGDVWFELHDHGELAVKYGENWEEYRKWLTEQTIPIYMQDVYPEFPSSVRFPIEEVREKFAYVETYVPGAPGTTGPREERPRASFKSTLSYMLALALMEGNFKEIHIYGVDMIIDSEWGFQRSNLYWFMGIAEGMGVKLVIPEECALLKEAGCDLYAYEHSTQKYAKLIHKMGLQDAYYKKECKALATFNEQLIAKCQTLNGCIQELDQLLKLPDEAMNGQRPLLEKRRKDYVAEFQKFSEKNEEVVNKLRHTEGARENNFRWMERLGYNDRGEQL
jgi:hypothetical protein